MNSLYVLRLARGAWPSAHALHNCRVFNSQVWSLSSEYNRKKVYNSVFTHTLSSHLALGRTRRGPAETVANEKRTDGPRSAYTAVKPLSWGGPKPNSGSPRRNLAFLGSLER